MPSHSEMDITNPQQVEVYLSCKKFDLIVLAAAYTNVEGAEDNKEDCWKVNVEGTRNIASFGIPVLYISTEYVFDGEKGNYTEEDEPNPINFYSYTKYQGELELPDNCKIIRTLFKPRPFEYAKAFIDQWTSGDYVDVIAKEISKAITLFDKLPRIIHIGTGRKSIFDLAMQTRNVEPIKRASVNTPLPKDCSLDCSVWKELIEKELELYDPRS